MGLHLIYYETQRVKRFLLSKQIIGPVDMFIQNKCNTLPQKVKRLQRLRTKLMNQPC